MSQLNVIASNKYHYLNLLIISLFSCPKPQASLRFPVPLAVPNHRVLAASVRQNLTGQLGFILRRYVHVIWRLTYIKCRCSAGISKYYKPGRPSKTTWLYNRGSFQLLILHHEINKGWSRNNFGWPVESAVRTKPV